LPERQPLAALYFQAVAVSRLSEYFFCKPKNRKKKQFSRKTAEIFRLAAAKLSVEPALR